MRARRAATARRARVHSYLRTHGTAAALLVLLAVLFAFAPRPADRAAAHADRAAAHDVRADVHADARDVRDVHDARDVRADAHVLEGRQGSSTATPLRPDVTARSLFGRIQAPLRRAWETRADAGFELVLPVHGARREHHAVATATCLLHTPDLLRRKTGSVSSSTTSLPPPPIA